MVFSIFGVVVVVFYKFRDNLCYIFLFDIISIVSVFFNIFGYRIFFLNEVFFESFIVEVDKS